MSVASANRTQALVATTGGSLYSLALGSAVGAGGDAMDVDGAAGAQGGAQGVAHALIHETASASLDGKEIACLDCTPLSDPGDAAARLCAVGTWTAEVALLTMPDLRLVTTSPLGGGGGGVIPRAV